MPQYFTFAIQSPTGAPVRMISYAPDANAALSRVRAWLASNPFQMGQTDFQDAMATGALNPSGTGISDVAPTRQGGDQMFDYPAAPAPPPIVLPSDPSAYAPASPPAGMAPGGIMSSAPPPTAALSTSAPPDTGSHNFAGQYTSSGQYGGQPMASNYDKPIQESDPYGVYRNYFNLPAFGASPFQRWQGRQMGATVGAYKLQQQNNPDLALRDYLNQTGIMGARTQIGNTYDSIVDSDNPETPDMSQEMLGDDWDDVVKQAIANKKGQYFAGALGPRLGMMRGQYEASPEGFVEPGGRGFLRNFLRARYGI